MLFRRRNECTATLETPGMCSVAHSSRRRRLQSLAVMFELRAQCTWPWERLQIRSGRANKSSVKSLGSVTAVRHHRRCHRLAANILKWRDDYFAQRHQSNSTRNRRQKQSDVVYAQHNHRHSVLPIWWFARQFQSIHHDIVYDVFAGAQSIGQKIEGGAWWQLGRRETVPGGQTAECCDLSENHFPRLDGCGAGQSRCHQNQYGRRKCGEWNRWSGQQRIRNRRHSFLLFDDAGRFENDQRC